MRLHLRDLRKRRGAFRSAAIAEAEIARLLDRLAPDTLERSVFELAEILRVPFKNIAAQLGVSERHLYRLRIAMLEQLAAGDTPAFVQPVSPPALQQLELARTLLRYGHAQSAQTVVSRLLESDMPPDHGVQALTVLATAQSDQECYDQAQRTLHEARMCAAHLEPERKAFAYRTIAMADAYIPYRDGASDRAVELTEAALGSCDETFGDAIEAREYIRALIFLAVQHEELGSPRRGLACLEKAHRLLTRFPVPPSAELAQMFIHRAFARAALPNESERARSDAEEALRVAQWHGLQFEEVWANLALGMLSDMAGKPKEGLSFVHHAVALGSSVLDGDPLIRTLFITARLEGASGNGDAALERLHVARPLAQNHGLLRGILEVADARARRHRGEVDKTIAASSRAIDALEGRALTHYLGIPYLSRAIALSKLGVDNSSDVERAVYYLDRGGALVDKAAAFELSYRLTRNRKDLQQARDLRGVASKIA